MATSKDLLSLQRKIARDSYHHTVHNHPERRPTIPRHDSNRSNKGSNSQMKHTSHLHSTTSQLPSKQSKRTRKKRKHDIVDYFHHNERKKSKSPNIMHIKQLMNRKLLQQYQQCVDERVQMLRSGAFPYEIIHQLPQYRADLTNCINKVLPKPYFSLHTEADQIAQAEQHALEETPKTHKKQSKLNSIRKGVFAPIQPIKKLFVTSKHKNFKESFNTNYTIAQLSPPAPITNYNASEGYSKEIDINKSKSISPLAEEENIKFAIAVSPIPKATQLESKSHGLNLKQKLWDIEVTESPNPAPTAEINGEVTPALAMVTPASELQHARTLDLAALLIDLPSEKTMLARANTTAVTLTKAAFIGNDTHDSASETPPFFAERSDNIRNETEHIFEETHLPYNTPSWALRDSTGSHGIPDTIPDTRPVDEVNMDMLEAKYNGLELVCQDLQISLREMQVAMNENNVAINLMKQRMEKMQNEMKEFECVDKKGPIRTVKLREELLEYENKNDSGFLGKLKNKIFEEQNIISFERTKWENIYHSLFCYFMNGLMVIFNGLTRLYIFFGFVLELLHGRQIIGIIIIILALFLIN